MSHSLFQNYLGILSSEHTAVDVTLVEAHDVLMQSQGYQLLVHGPPTVRKQPYPLDPDSFQHQNDESRCGTDGNFMQKDLVQLKKADVVKIGLNCETELFVEPPVGDVTGSVSVFKDEMEGVKNAMERYRQEQLQLEEQLTRELQQREVHYDLVSFPGWQCEAKTGSG